MTKCIPSLQNEELGEAFDVTIVYDTVPAKTLHDNIDHLKVRNYYLNSFSVFSPKYRCNSN